MRKKAPIVFSIVLLFHTLSMGKKDCPNSSEKNLSCYNDYNNNITCFWENSLSDHRDNLCRVKTELRKFIAECKLEPVDASKPARQKCSLIFKSTYVFSSHTQLSMNLSCINLNKTLTYQPSCHIKLNPPGKPSVNITTVSWSNQVVEHVEIKNFKSQLQWKQKHQSWTDSSVNKSTIQKECNLACKAQLDRDLLVEGETYEARVRVKQNEMSFNGTWSDWSPTESWVSSVGTAKPQSEMAVNVINLITVGLVLFGISVIFIFFKTNKITWVYIVKRISGPPIPNPGKATELQTWLSPNFTKEFFCSYLKPVEILSVEVTAKVDAVAPCRMDVEKKSGNLDPTNSSFDNPSYAELCPPTVSSAGLEACTYDMSSAPVCVKEESNDLEAFKETMKQKKTDILDLFFKGTTTGDSALVISDYEMVEKLQLERHRLQSADSGICSYKEFSLESGGVNSKNRNHFHNVDTEDKRKEEEHHQRKIDFQKLFGGCGDVLSGQAIQVCFDYERLPNMQLDSPELPSLESGVGSLGEEHESLERFEENYKPTETTHFLFPPDSPNTQSLPEFLTCSGLKPHSQLLLSKEMHGGLL